MKNIEVFYNVPPKQVIAPFTDRWSQHTEDLLKLLVKEVRSRDHLKLLVSECLERLEREYSKEVKGYELKEIEHTFRTGEANLSWVKSCQTRAKKFSSRAQIIKEARKKFGELKDI